ncbi:hypothetical protein T492DRAFT_859776 [Pavlovales sp. CCMP2436]|nr:hypothetical protein T492DRAFT_859776 [Pavlovales sp. CCMP2436]
MENQSGGGWAAAKAALALVPAWDERVGYLAAAGRHLEVLRYAHEHGCPGQSAVRRLLVLVILVIATALDGASLRAPAPPQEYLVDGS